MPTKSFFKATEYALGVSASDGKKIAQGDLRDMFKRAALRNGLQVSTYSEYASEGEKDTVVTFRVADNTSFKDMEPILDIVRDAVKGVVVVSLPEDIEGKRFTDIKEDRLGRMYKERILASNYSR